MAYDIGGMLARSGATTGQLMAGGIADVGAGLGGLLTRRREKQAEQNAQQQFQQILGAYQNNPAGMRTEAQSMVASGDPNLQRVGKLLMDEATRLEGVRTAQTAALETSQQDIQREAQRKRAMQVAMQDGNENALVALKAGALDPVEYLKSRATAKPEPTQYDYSEETIIGEDGKPLRIQVGVSKTNPLDRVVVPIGQAVPSGDKGGSKNLNQLLLDAGLDPADYDTTTVEGLKKIRSFVITDIGNASLANTLTSMIEEKAPIGVTAAFDMINKIDPSFAAAQEDLSRVEKFKGLQTLADQDVSGLKNLLERVVRGTTESDVKAVSELQQFRGDKDLVNKIKDFASGLVSGKLSPETVSEYAEIMEIVGALAEQRQLSTINSLIISGTPKEAEGAARAKTFILEGRNQARIVN